MVQTNPFTPQSGLEPKFFSGRENALSEFISLLKEGKVGRAEHLLIIGEWGIGKTALLRQFKKIAQREGCWVAYCGVNKGERKESVVSQLRLILEEIMLVLPLRDEEVNLLRKELDFKQKEFFPLQIRLAQFFLHIWNRMQFPLAFILLDDVQNFLPRVEIIDLLRATLSREDVIGKTKFCFVLSSTPEGWNNFLDKHDPIGRFFRRKVILEPFNREEVFRFIEGSLEGTGIDFTSQIKERIFLFTRGHPYELQLLCSNLFDAQLNGVVDENSWEVALRNTLRDLGREYFEVLYHKASEREKELISIFMEKNSPLSLQDLRSIMILERRAKNFPIANIKNFVYRLVDKGLLKKREDNTYVLLDNLFREYLLRFKSDEARD
ncbi:MAG: ATP-binding protein [Candidatus Omnitrophica bacterium]|nr:ATP-binding protein [Candidatus Omnitrophota bacterium]MCM8798062.1 ATP-binding protein [Candidatus Omnitrophota bacterium]